MIQIQPASLAAFHDFLSKYFIEIIISLFYLNPFYFFMHEDSVQKSQSIPTVLSFLRFRELILYCIHYTINSKMLHEPILLSGYCRRFTNSNLQSIGRRK